MIIAVENAQRGDISTQGQSVRSFTEHWVPNDSNGPTLYQIDQADIEVHQSRDEIHRYSISGRTWACTGQLVYIITFKNVIHLFIFINILQFSIK